MKALLYDMGGVLVRTDHEAVFRHWSSAAGEPIANLRRRWQASDAYRAFEVGSIDFEEFAASLSRQLQITLSLEDWRTGWNQLLAGTFDDVLAEARRIGGAIPQCIFTNTNPVHEACWRRLYGHRLTDFRHIYVSSTIGLRKPNQDAYRHVAADMGFPCEEITFLDDNADNITGAQAVGMQTVHVTRPEVAKRFLTSVEVAGG